MSTPGLLEELDQVGRRVILVVRLVVERRETIEGELERVLHAVLLAVAELNAIDEEQLRPSLNPAASPWRRWSARLAGLVE